MDVFQYGKDDNRIKGMEENYMLLLLGTGGHGDHLGSVTFLL